MEESETEEDDESEESEVESGGEEEENDEDEDDDQGEQEESLIGAEFSASLWFLLHQRWENPIGMSSRNLIRVLSAITVHRSFRGLDKIFESKPLPQHPYFRPSMDSHADLPNGGLNPVGKSLFEVEIPYLERLNSANLHTDHVNHGVHDATSKSLSEAFASRGVIHALFAEDMLPALTVDTIERGNDGGKRYIGDVDDVGDESIALERLLHSLGLNFESWRFARFEPFREDRDEKWAAKDTRKMNNYFLTSSCFASFVSLRFK
ncbi:hypothetical protein IWX49DRAFT_632019 [Phyllosticta citricarpa]|uniref:Uncharacterized protein n=1 Tax=Phyllosticta paracitricarpa TaxID=2016321 RepID=A0ABR1N2E1_9PEZI